MLSPLLAYDANGNVIHNLEFLVARDENGNAIGVVDFDAYEREGGKLRALCEVYQWEAERLPDGSLGPKTATYAAGSATWPEWLGPRAHEFRVELDGQKRISALVHRTSGARRERRDVEAAIAARIADAKGAPADIRDLVGGPDRPLALDTEGRTAPRIEADPAAILPARRVTVARPESAP